MFGWSSPPPPPPSIEKLEEKANLPVWDDEPEPSTEPTGHKAKTKSRIPPPKDKIKPPGTPDTHVFDHYTGQWIDEKLYETRWRNRLEINEEATKKRVI